MSTPRNDDLRTGREYLRVSVDRSGRSRSTDEQHEDNARTAEGHGIQLGVPYLDTNRSASRYARVAREDFDTLVADLREDRFGADHLVLWESSRGSRKVGEWVELIELLEQRRVRVLVTTHGRVYDPANPRDRRSLLEDAVDSEYESAKTSLRVRRDTASAAAKGRPHGRPPFGYRRRYDPVSGVLSAQEIDPDEAPLVRELFDRLVAGHSLYAIAKDWRERGIVNRSGKPFLAPHLRNMALNEAYRGLRLHSPGRRGGNRPSEDAVISLAAWPALVPAPTFLAVRRLLTAPERRVSRPGRGIHLLSMIAVCDPCGSVLHVQYVRGVAQYRCKERGCAGAVESELDGVVEREIVLFLARPELRGQLSEDETENAELAGVRTELAEARTLVVDLVKAVTSKQMTVQLAGQVERETRQQIVVLERRERELTTPSVLRGLIEPGADVAARWEAAPMSTKRMVARILLTPEWMGEVRVRPSGRGRRRLPVPVGERVVFLRTA
ncbi:MAG TPA: recombinase family protein [Pseudonocardiaceae bacterium]|nr:recombinase family protein [Pseudonocardiaceae bacterium]